MSAWLVLWLKDRRMGSWPFAEDNIQEASSLMQLRLIQEDSATGTRHYEIQSVRRLSVRSDPRAECAGNTPNR